MFANFGIALQFLSTIPFCSWCLVAAVLNFMLFSPHYFLNMSDLNSDPASDLIWLMLFKFLSRQGNFDISYSIPSIHASDDLSLSHIALHLIVGKLLISLFWTSFNYQFNVFILKKDCTLFVFVFFLNRNIFIYHLIAMNW